MRLARIGAAGLLVSTVLVAPARAAEPTVTNGCVPGVLQLDHVKLEFNRR